MMRFWKRNKDRPFRFDLNDDELRIAWRALYFYAWDDHGYDPEACALEKRAANLVPRAEDDPGWSDLVARHEKALARSRRLTA